MTTHHKPTTSETGLLLRVRDRGLHAHIQQYPFCTGPDEALNRASFAATLNSIELRRAECFRPLEAIERFELAEEQQVRRDASDILHAIGLSEMQTAEALASRCWKACLIPPDAGSVLALGCGEGDEIAALRARLPNAKIRGLDWVDKVLPGLLDAANVGFDHGDFNERLADCASSFDVVFSNHVIEHSFDPDELFRSIRASLKPGGYLVSALPLDGESANPVFQHVLALARDPGRIRRRDMFLLAAGHSYKTNASELTAALLAAGFRSARIAYRPWSPTPYDKVSAMGLDASRAMHMRLNRAFLGSLRGMVDAVFGPEPPLAALRALGAIESRAPFGIIGMLTHKVMEAVVVAKI